MFELNELRQALHARLADFQLADLRSHWHAWNHVGSDGRLYRIALDSDNFNVWTCDCAYCCEPQLPKCAMAIERYYYARALGQMLLIESDAPAFLARANVSGCDSRSAWGGPPHDYDGRLQPYARRP